jgi:hypothetical protein
LLTIERVSQHCTLDTDALDRLQHPLRIGAQRVSALRFADPRVLAVLEALCGLAHVPAGFRHRDLRARIAALLGQPYSAGRLTYDLRRLRLRGLIERRGRSHAYLLTPYGRRVAFFYSTLYLRMLRPHAPALVDQPDPLPRPLRAAFEQLDVAIDRICQEAALAA